MLDSIDQPAAAPINALPATEKNTDARIQSNRGKSSKSQQPSGELIGKATADMRGDPQQHAAPASGSHGEVEHSQVVNALPSQRQNSTEGETRRSAAASQPSIDTAAALHTSAGDANGPQTDGQTVGSAQKDLQQPDLWVRSVHGVLAAPASEQQHGMEVASIADRISEQHRSTLGSDMTTGSSRSEHAEIQEMHLQKQGLPQVHVRDDHERLGQLGLVQEAPSDLGHDWQVGDVPEQAGAGSTLLTCSSSQCECWVCMAAQLMT